MNDPAYPDALPAQYRMHWYTVERALGQGGFGITYLARDTNLDQMVAIKEYLPVEVATRIDGATVRSRGEGQRDRYRWGLERFIQEARTLARFDHPNIVRVHSVFEHNGTAYMVMRFEEGDNLGALLERRGTLPEKELLRILLPILDGLELVHGAGFIHRDIKPDNIHIRTDGSPVLLDFGSARHALGKAHTLTILVAPGYAPFEQYYSNSESQGPWTDIYGLGATCYRAIAGTPPLDAITRSKGILGSTREVLVPASTVGHGRYSNQLLAAIDHALAFAEKERPQTVAAWRRELMPEAAVAAPHATAAPHPPAARATDGAGPVPAAPAPVVAGGSARAPLIWATVGAVAGAIAIAVFLAVSGKNGSEPRPPEAKAPVADDKERRVEAEKRRQAEAEKQRQAEAEKQRQAEAEKQRQAEAEKQRQAEAEKQRRAEAEKQRQAEAEKQRRAEAEKRRQADADRQRQAEAERQRQAEAERQRQAEVERQRRAEAEKQGRAEAEKQRQAEAAKLGQAEAEKQRQAEAAKRRLASAADAVSRGSFEEAKTILKSLAESGNAVAQNRLGAMHEEGRGGPADNFQAYIWYSLAMQCGDVSAGAGKARVSVRLQQAQVNQADRLVTSLGFCPKGGSAPAASLLTEGERRKAAE